jgi:hypothetical protein
MSWGFVHEIGWGVLTRKCSCKKKYPLIEWVILRAKEIQKAALFLKQFASFN